MVRCPVCGNITRFNGKNCLECGYKYSAEEITTLSEKEKQHKGRMFLRVKLKDRAFWCDILGTLSMVISLIFIGPAFINLFGYFKAEQRIGANKLSHDAKMTLVWGIVYASLVVILLITSVILFAIKRRSIRKNAKMQNVL